MKKYTVVVMFTMLASCATVPHNYTKSVELEGQGIKFLKERHERTVNELTDNWYQLQFHMLKSTKMYELAKHSIVLPNPGKSGETIEVIEKTALLKIEDQYDSAIIDLETKRKALIAGYLDSENWNKLKELHDINSSMAQSLYSLNEAQTRFYDNLLGSIKEPFAPPLPTPVKKRITTGEERNE